MEKVTDLLKNIGIAKTWAALSILLVSIIFIMFIGIRYSGPELALLFGNLDKSASQQIQIELSRRQVVYDAREDGASIFVPRDQLENLRLALAEIGLSGAIVGYEIFDKDTTVSSSNFEQRLNALRALEGEMARTISSIKGVVGARVHIVLPRRELFSKTETRSSASIVLKMGGVQRLDRTQINAIQHLISSAVPKLKVSDISIVDDQGALLARGGRTDESGQSSAVNDMRVQEEDRLRSHIEGLLVRTLGFGKARVEVRVEVNQSRVEINDETFDPNSSTLRSNETIEEASNANTGENQAVTVGNNLPNDQPDALGGNSSNENASRTEERRNFEISRQVRNTIIQPGTIERISVAVLVDGEYTTAEDGTAVYQARPEEEINQINALVRSAIGYNDDRGDLVEVVNMQFATLPGDLIEAEVIYLGLFNASDLKRFLELFVLAAVGFLIVFLVVRPLIGRMFDTADNQVAASIGKGMVRLPDGRMVFIDPETGEQQELPVATRRGDAPGEGFKPEEDEQVKPLDEVLSGNLDGKVQANAIKKIGDIIDKHPEEAVQILRSWIYADSY